MPKPKTNGSVVDLGNTTELLNRAGLILDSLGLGVDGSTGTIGKTFSVFFITTSNARLVYNVPSRCSVVAVHTPGNAFYLGKDINQTAANLAVAGVYTNLIACGIGTLTRLFREQLEIGDILYFQGNTASALVVFQLDV